MKDRKKLLIIAIVQMLLFECTVVISAGNGNETEWQKTVVERQYF